MKLTPERARAILAKRALSRKAFDVTRLFDPNFPQQLKFVQDPSNLKTLWCTRRAAKSYTAGLYMVTEAIQNPGSNILFIGLTRASAKAIVWKDILMAISKRHGLKARFNKAELSMSFSNGSVIFITGVDSDESEMLKLLGKKYRLVCIDEASMYSVDVRNLVYGVLRPAMVDPNSQGLRGTICLMGTSSNFPRGLFFDITTGKERGWSLHTWTAYENPYVATQWAEEMEEIKRDRPMYLETPQYKQFYLNEWAVDDSKLVYRFDDQRNLYKDLPVKLSPEGWRFVLGVDTGWEDDNAFVLCGYHENDPHLYVIRTFNKPRMTFDQVVIKINEFMLDPQYPVSKVIIDGANKQGVESMRIRSAIPFEYADKQGKVDFIEMLNGDLIQAKIKINQRCEALTDELRGLVWLTDGDKIVLPKKENPSLSNHLCDAFLYAWRNGYHYHSTPKEVKLVKYSKEWYNKQAEDIWERERELLEKGNSDGWGDEGGWGEV
jgi:phage terminase large subunit